MANYLFETMSASDASSFTTDDRLLFTSTAVNALGVTDTPASTNGLVTTLEAVTLSADGHMLTFGAVQLSGATAADHLIFFNGDALAVGTDGDETIQIGAAQAGHGTATYGFDGNDTISGTSAANDTICGGAGSDVIFGSSSHQTGTAFDESDYYNGGSGDDTINGGDGNDHIYGDAFGSAAGADDGRDFIFAGGGNDYVQGNAGDDSIRGYDGNDRLYGGSGDDLVSGGNGHDYLQGNKGDDHLAGDDGNDTLHGGADNDHIFGEADNDRLFGDSGDDSIVGGTGYDILTGGVGNDVFGFFSGAFNGGPSDAPDDNLRTAAAAPNHGLVDEITDFTSGEDHIELRTFTSGVSTPTGVIHAPAGVTFADATAADTFAQALLHGHPTEIVALTVGSDTYLFFNDDLGSDQVNSAIKVDGVTANAFAADGSDFV